jgi:glycosyltransferase involved in cell wall biosynthesis
MRILCLTPWFPAFPGAQSGNFILDSVNALQTLGHSVKVLVAQPWHPGWGGMLHPDWGRLRLHPESHSASLGLEQIRYPSIPRNYLRGLSNWACIARVVPAMKRAAETFRPDVILAHTEMLGMVGVKSGKAMGIPVAIVLHGINTTPRLNTPAQLKIVGKALAAADRIVLVGETLFGHFAPIASRNNHFRIVHNGFCPHAMEGYGNHSGWGLPLRFISVSNLHEGKGIDLNLQALAKLHQNGQRDWIYTVVGDGRERTSLEAMAKNRGIADHVHFIGAVNHNEVYGHLAQADIFILPSYREAFGVAYLEAMACGLLAIGVRGQGPAAFIRNDETGLLVEPNDVGDLATCLQKVIENPAEMQAIAKAGHDFVRSEFTWQRHAEKMESVLGEIVTG